MTFGNTLGFKFFFRVFFFQNGGVLLSGVGEQRE